MAADTLIKEDFRIRKVAGGLFVFLGVPLTLISARFGLFIVDSFGGFLALITGPLMMLTGLWLAFPRRKPAVRLRITDDHLEITMARAAHTIALDDLLHISLHRPLSGKHDRLTIVGGTDDVKLDIIHLTHDARDIINLIGIRLERRNRYLQEGRTEVFGAPNRIWTVHQGLPFENTTSRGTIPHGRE